MHRRRRGYLHPLALRNGTSEGGVLESDGVRQQAVDRSDEHVDRRDRPREGKALEHGLVREVEAHVHRIPKRDEAGRNEAFLERARLDGLRRRLRSDETRIARRT